MKKFLVVFNIIMPFVAAVFTTLKFVFSIGWFAAFSIGAIALQVITNLWLNKNKKDVANILFVGGIILQLAAILFVMYGRLWAVVAELIVALTIAASMHLKNKISWEDLVYSGVIAAVSVCFILFSGVVGFISVLELLIAIALVCVLSIIVGKSLSSLIKSRNTHTSLQFAASVVLFLAGFLLLLGKYSYITHYILWASEVCMVIAAVLFSLCVMLETLIKPSEEAIENVKTFTWGKLVALSLVMLFVSFSAAVSFTSFGIATAKISKQEFLEMVGDDLSIPIIEINTQFGEFPTSKEDYVNASFEISNCDNPDDNRKIEMAKSYEDDGSVGIRLRGNSTKNAKKKPFRIKFDEKQSFFGLKENKSWVLLADYFDQSYMRNFAAFSIAKHFDNLDFTPSPNHVALILNGEFYGLYLMCEQVDENKGRTAVKADFDVNTDTDFPFLVEMDNLAHKEGETGVNNFYVDDFYPVEIKYPEAGDLEDGQSYDKVYDYIYEYINAVFYTLKTGTKINVSFRPDAVSFEDLVDIDSAVDYYLVTEIMHNPDSIYKSIYLHKTKDGKLKFGPVWDFDYSLTRNFDLPYKESSIEEAKNLFVAKNSKIFNKLMQSESFYNKVKTRYNTLATSFYDEVHALKDYKQKIDIVAQIDSKMWHGKTGVFQFDMQYDYVRLFLYDRYEFLNSAFSGSQSEFFARF